MDFIFTGDDASDGGHVDIRLQEREEDVYRNVDETETIDQNYLRRAADFLSNYNWEGNVVYVSDVIVPPGCDGNIRVVENFIKYLKFSIVTFVIVSVHDDHVHVAHACKQANNACRCSWIQRNPDFRKYRRKLIRRRIFTCDLSSDDWANIIIYFCTNGHYAKEMYIPGADAFINIKEFYQNPALNRLDENDKKVKVTLRNWCSTIRDWDIFDFNTYFHTTGVKPYFNAYARMTNNLYYDVEKSIEISNKLLYYQFNNDEHEIKSFLTVLYNIIDKKIPKLNSLCIYSEPSAGKIFFFDAVASFFLNYGMFGTANKNNNFTWADGAGKRIVIWNEPNYETHHIEK